MTQMPIPAFATRVAGSHYLMWVQSMLIPGPSPSDVGDFQGSCDAGWREITIIT